MTTFYIFLWLVGIAFSLIWLVFPFLAIQQGRTICEHLKAIRDYQEANHYLLTKINKRSEAKAEFDHGSQVPDTL